VWYRNKEFVIAGVNGSGLFQPEDHGLRPAATSSANWRGYVCSYRVKEDFLHLEELTIGLGAGEESQHPSPPALFGIEASVRPDGHEADYRFGSAPIAFSGGLLLGKGFIDDLYVHMGFHPAWKFRQVVELMFEEGRLTAAHDHSQRIAEIRDGITSANNPTRTRGRTCRPGYRGHSSSTTVERLTRAVHSCQRWKAQPLDAGILEILAVNRRGWPAWKEAKGRVGLDAKRVLLRGGLRSSEGPPREGEGGRPPDPISGAGGPRVSAAVDPTNRDPPR